jgi:hypothetical protein
MVVPWVRKSALAQTLADNFQQRTLLAVARFFFKSENGEQLIPTLVSQLTSKALKETGPFTEETIRSNRSTTDPGLSPRLCQNENGGFNTS